jgi:hypothetical protein
MTESHTISKQGKIYYQCKLGILDEMLYVRRQEAEFLEAFDSEYDANIPMLLADTSTVWRFPWPDEDVVISCDTERRKAVSYDKLIEAIAQRHERTLAFSADLNNPSLEHRPGCYQRFSYKLIWERYCLKGGRTIICCSSCEKLYSLSQTEVEQIIRPAILSLQLDPMFLEKVALRIKANPNE